MAIPRPNPGASSSLDAESVLSVSDSGVDVSVLVSESVDVSFASLVSVPDSFASLADASVSLSVVTANSENPCVFAVTVTLSSIVVSVSSSSHSSPFHTTTLTENERVRH